VGAFEAGIGLPALGLVQGLGGGAPSGQVAAQGALGQIGFGDGIGLVALQDVDDGAG